MQQGGVACKAEGDYAVFLRFFAPLRHCTTFVTPHPHSPSLARGGVKIQ